MFGILGPLLITMKDLLNMLQYLQLGHFRPCIFGSSDSRELLQRAHRRIYDQAVEPENDSPVRSSDEFIDCERT
jgi:hypothetical protein